MTIKSTGGIFGRNPTFNDVTIEGSVSVPDDSISGNAIDGGEASPEAISIEKTDDPTITLKSLKNGSWTVGESVGSIDFYSSDVSGSGPKVIGSVQCNVGFTSGGGAGLDFFSHNTAALTKRFSIETLGDVVFYQSDGSTPGMTWDNSENALSFVSGGGIDFSATGDGSGTSTSELFDDYEEGEWTPVYTPVTGAFDSVTYDTQVGKYTKVGNIVNVRVSLRTDAITVGTASGAVSIDGLPYTPAGNNSSGIYSAGFGGDAPDIARASGSSIALYFRSASSANASLLQVSDLGTGANDNYVFISLIYEAS